MTSPETGPAPGAGGGGALLVRGGYVITMDPGTGDVPDGDVLVSDGAIAAVGPGLTAPAGARVIDATGMIIAPGLVDTHWHMWNTLLRAMSETGPGYFRLCRGLGPAFGPGDVFQGTLLACAEAVSSGITTVHDWAHNVRGPQYADAGLRALAQAGLRRLHAEWPGYAAGGLLSLGVACRGPGGSDPAMHVPEAVYGCEFDAARELGLPVTIHACGPPHAAGQIDALAREGLLRPDVQVVHANCATAAEIGHLADAGATVSISPFSELLVGYGMPQTAELLAAGVPLGLSADTTALTGNADMFAIMKVTRAWPTRWPGTSSH